MQFNHTDSKDQSEGIKIEGIKIKWLTDEMSNPEDELTQFKDSADPEEQKYYTEDANRLAHWYQGDWYMQGCVVEATVSYSIGQGSRRLETLSSGGLWGVESDSEDDYKAHVESEELDDLKDHLARFNVDVSNFGELSKSAEGRV